MASSPANDELTRRLHLIPVTDTSYANATLALSYLGILSCDSLAVERHYDAYRRLLGVMLHLLGLPPVGLPFDAEMLDLWAEVMARDVHES